MFFSPRFNLKAVQLQVILDCQKKIKKKNVATSEPIGKHAASGNCRSLFLKFVYLKPLQWDVNHTCLRKPLERSGWVTSSHSVYALAPPTPRSTLSCGLKHKEAYLRCLYFADCRFEGSGQEGSRRWFSSPDVCNHHFTSPAASLSTQCSSPKISEYGILLQETWELLVSFDFFFPPSSLDVWCACPWP